MSTTLRPGARLFSAVCTTELIVVRTPKGDLDVTIGGAEPLASVAARDSTRTPLAGHDAGSEMGKRYVDLGETIELLCTKPGAGRAAVDGVVLQVKDAKALPASD